MKKCDLMRFGVAAAICTAVGCGGDLPQTAPVSGRVEFDGKPLAGFDHAAVLFTPRGGRMASGVVAEDGTFELSTFEAGDGARIGLNHVTVSATVDAPGAVEVDRGVGVRWIIPRKFSGDDSGLSYDVRPAEQHRIVIRLSSQGEGTILDLEP